MRGVRVNPADRDPVIRVSHVAIDPDRDAAVGDSHKYQVVYVARVVGDATVVLDDFGAQFANEVFFGHRIVHAASGDKRNILSSGAGGMQLFEDSGQHPPGRRGTAPVVGDHNDLFARKIFLGDPLNPQGMRQGVSGELSPSFPPGRFTGKPTITFSSGKGISITPTPAAPTSIFILS